MGELVLLSLLILMITCQGRCHNQIGLCVILPAPANLQGGRLLIIPPLTMSKDKASNQLNPLSFSKCSTCVNIKLSDLVTGHWSYGPLVLRAIGPTGHWSYRPLVLRVIGPTGHWSYGPLVLQAIGPPGHWSYGPLVLQAIGPPGHWSYGPLVLQAIGPPGHWSYGPLVLRVIGPTGH